MSCDNLFPSFKKCGVLCRALMLCLLSVAFIAAMVAQVAGQARAMRPLARLVSSTRRDMPLTRAVLPPAAGGAKADTVSDFKGESPEPVSAAIASLERQVFNLVNSERLRKGEEALVWDDELCRMAELHSQHMARRNFFAHTGPDGMDLEKRARAMGVVGWKALGENIAYNQGFADPAALAVQGWMHSEGHRANILNPRFERSAIGAARTADGRVYLTQVFMAR